MFEFKLHNALFQQILQGSSHCLNTLKLVNKIVGVKPLTRKLFLRMDNCVKDNKNHHMLAFLSLLIAKDFSEKIQWGFLVVGHTHEDIDGSFGYLSKKLKDQNNYVMVDLMKAFMLSQDCPFISQLIHEILDFQILGQWIFERWPKHLCWSYIHAFVLVFCG
jgi:hypothetical protein